MIDTLITIIMLGGGIAGYTSLIYLLWKKFRKDIKIYEISGIYKAEKAGSESLTNINAIVEVGFLNNSDETISITDVVGVLRYNKELYEKRILSETDVPRIPEVYTERPDNFQEIVNFSIEPHKATNKTITFSFPNMILDYIDRIRLGYFMGFVDGKIPLFTSDEREFKERWSQHPLTLLLSVHIDGKRLIHRTIVLWKDEKIFLSGTLNVVDIEKIKKEYQEEKI